jgi:GNAT superfamily N-acetyltransferase
MIIRPATPSDSPAMADLHAASWRLAYRGAMSDEYLAGDIATYMRELWGARLSAPPANQHTFVAEEGDQLLGLACIYGNESAEWGNFLNNIHVAHAAQGRGVGAALLQAVATCCVDLYGERGLYLFVLQANEKAQRFYAHYGAENVGDDVWQAPDGTESPLFRFAWRGTRQLRAATANPRAHEQHGRYC